MNQEFRRYSPISAVGSVYLCSCRVGCEKVELVDSGLDGPASETLLGVLLERAGTISKLDLSGNRIGPKGASGLSRLIAHKRELCLVSSRVLHLDTLHERQLWYISTADMEAPICILQESGKNRARHSFLALCLCRFQMEFIGT